AQERCGWMPARKLENVCIINIPRVEGIEKIKTDDFTAPRKRNDDIERMTIDEQEPGIGQKGLPEIEKQTGARVFPSPQRTRGACSNQGAYLVFLLRSRREHEIARDE